MSQYIFIVDACVGFVLNKSRRVVHVAACLMMVWIYDGHSLMFDRVLICLVQCDTGIGPCERSRNSNIMCTGEWPYFNSNAGNCTKVLHSYNSQIWIPLILLPGSCSDNLLDELISFKHTTKHLQKCHTLRQLHILNNHTHERFCSSENVCLYCGDIAQLCSSEWSSFCINRNCVKLVKMLSKWRCYDYR